jgi:hypothetical protein
MTQIRNIYQVHDPELNQVLQDIANRLDILEGLRPDLDAGFVNLNTDKEISTGDPTSGYQTIVAGVEIADNSIKITDGDLILDNSNLNVIVGASGNLIEVYDADNQLIHKMG